MPTDSQPPLLLLPGLDGTGQLLQPFLSQLPGGISTYVASFPADRPLSYDDLLPLVREKVPDGLRHAVLAESFSGPLAIRYARARRDDVLAVVLCASFVKCPIPRWLACLSFLANPLLLAVPVPRCLVRALMLSPDTPDSVLEDVRASIRRVKPAVLAHRIRSTLSVDATRELSELDVPVFYLAGSRDRLVGPRGLKGVLEARPSTIVRTLDAPHCLLETRPREAAEAVLELLASTPSPTAS